MTNFKLRVDFFIKNNVFVATYKCHFDEFTNLFTSKEYFTCPRSFEVTNAIRLDSGDRHCVILT